MADIKISQLGAAIAVGDTDLLPIVSGGNTLKATAAQVKEHSIGNTNISSMGDGSVTGAISALNTDKQPKTLATPLTIGGVSKTTVEDALGGLVSENQTLTNHINSTKAILLSDSFGTVKNSYNQTMFDIADLLSSRTVIKSAVSGASFSGTPNFLAQLQSVTDDDQVSDIYVFGGANDVTANARADIEQGISTFVTYAKTHFPNALIHIGYEGIHWTIPSYIALAHSMVMSAYESIINYGGDYIKDFYSVMHDPEMTYDGLHPTEAAVNKLGRQIARLLNGLPINSVIDKTYGASDCTPVSPVRTVDYFQAAERVENGIVTLGSNQGSALIVTLSSATDITTFTSLFTVDKSCIFPTVNALPRAIIPVLAKVTHSDSSVTLESMYLYKFQNGFSVVPSLGVINDVTKIQMAVPEIIYSTTEV